MFALDFVVKATDGELISQASTTFARCTYDNRDANIADSLFIPLIGESHDAHKFVFSAVTNGATGVLFQTWDPQWELLKGKASFIKVGDTLKALQDLGAAWRQQLQGTVIGLTGSNGKTTTKDFLTQILESFGGAHSSKGSYNNHWGVPMTLLSCPKDQKFCVTEMGMNHAGEITDLVNIASPNIVTVTNVGRAHMGNFSDGIDGVAKAKEEIYAASKPATKMIFNIDNTYTAKMYQKYAERESYTFSLKNFSADVYFRKKGSSENGLLIEGQIGGELGQAEVSFFGEHNIENLCAATALAYIAGCSPSKLWGALSHCHSGWGRNQWVTLKSGGKALFDGYNANPDSFQQLLSNVGDLTASKSCMAIFGEMLELGEQSEEEHYQLGLKAGQLAWKHCLFIGPSGSAFVKGWNESKNSINPIILDTYEESLDLDFLSMVDPQSQFIVKGSRGSALERVIERLDPIEFSAK